MNRLLLRRWSRGPSGPDQLWDRDGQLWELAVDELGVDRTLDLFLNASVPVAIYEGSGTLRWVEPVEPRKRWAELEKRTFDERWSPPACAPGARPFMAQ